MQQLLYLSCNNRRQSTRKRNSQKG